MLAAVGLLEDANRHDTDATGAADLHPRRQSNGILELADSRWHRDLRPGRALEMTGLAVGEVDAQWAVEAIALDAVAAFVHRPACSPAHLVLADHLEGRRQRDGHAHRVQ